MPLIRVYLPLTPADLTDLAEGRPLGPAPRAAHAVTPALGKPGLVTDEEELEHAAWVAATEEALAAVVAHPTVPDVPSRVELSAPVERRRIVSFHIDEEPGSSEPTDLLWYDVTELAAVRALLAQP